MNDDLREYYANAGTPKTYRPKKARQRIRVRPTSQGERKRRDAVRQTCVDRDGPCRFGMPSGEAVNYLDKRAGDIDFSRPGCYGPSEWAHMHSRRRSKTRGMDPTYRHDTAHSLMLCRFHHGEYDAKRLVITALTRKGANGALKFRRAKSSRPPLEAKA